MVLGREGGRERGLQVVPVWDLQEADGPTAFSSGWSERSSSVVVISYLGLDVWAASSRC